MAQRGEVKKKPNGTWAYRYYDAYGKRRQRGGFLRKSEAQEALAHALTQSRLGPLYKPDITLAELVSRYLNQHQADPTTIKKLSYALAKAVTAFGHVPVRHLLAEEISGWRSRLPEGSRWDAARALRQVLNAAVRWGYLDDNPARHVRNPQPRPQEFQPFADWEEVHRLAGHLPARFRSIPVVATGTGLRTEEWIALEWRDVDLQGRVLHVRRAFSDSRLKELKTANSTRSVPLRQAVLDALADHPRRLDSALVFPNLSGKHIDLHAWRRRYWKPALNAAGITSAQRPYDMRHTYATWSLRAGMNTFALARRMGTSLQMIERTYGHLAADADDHELGLLDAYDASRLTSGRIAAQS